MEAIERDGKRKSNIISYLPFYIIQLENISHFSNESLSVSLFPSPLQKAEISRWAMFHISEARNRSSLSNFNMSADS